MKLTIPLSLSCALLLPLSTDAAQQATIETRDGKQFSGVVEFGKETISIRASDGQSHSVPLAEMRLATFGTDPDQPANPISVPQNGLRGRYYSNIKHEKTPVERIDPVISFDWGESAPIEGVQQNGFSVRWEGEVEAPVSGDITFEVESDDGSRLWVDGKQLVDHWEAQAATTHGGTIKLEANRRYPIKVECYDAWSLAVARLRWKAEGLPHEIIPAKYLFPLPLNNPSQQKHHHEVRLRSGSTLAGKITLADSKRIHLETAHGEVVIPCPAVSYLKFTQSSGSDLGQLLKRKAPGVAYLNRDYAEGKFTGFKDGIATMESVLFGPQSIQQAELRAIKLTDMKAVSVTMWLLTTSDTRMMINGLQTLPDGRIKLRDGSGYHITVPAGQLRQIRAGLGTPAKQ